MLRQTFSTLFRKFGTLQEALATRDWLRAVEGLESLSQEKQTVDPTSVPPVIWGLVNMNKVSLAYKVL